MQISVSFHASSLSSLAFDDNDTGLFLLFYVFLTIDRDVFLSFYCKNGRYVSLSSYFLQILTALHLFIMLLLFLFARCLSRIRLVNDCIMLRRRYDGLPECFLHSAYKLRWFSEL